MVSSENKIDDVIGLALREAIMNAVVEMTLRKHTDWEFWLIGHDNEDLLAPALISPSGKQVIGHDGRLFPFSFSFDEFEKDPNIFRVGAL